jgi:hypothetical protein
MSKDIHVNVLLPVENFVVFKNKLRKEMAETLQEDLEMYKKFEWERAVEWWGASWDNIMNNKMDLNLLVQVRDLLGYSWETHPVTPDECKIINKREADKRVAEFNAKIEAKKAAKQAAWNALTAEEQEFELKMKFFYKAAIIALSLVAFVGFGAPKLLNNWESTPPPAGCPTGQWWDGKECKNNWGLD